MKTCSKCEIQKDESAFQLRKDTKKSRGRCRDCVNLQKSARVRVRYESDSEFKTKMRIKAQRQYVMNPEKALARQRKRRQIQPNETWKFYQIKHQYGISRAEYERLIEGQEGKCAVCKEVKKLVVDHCHDSNKVRGLLCYRCNTLVGIVEGSLKEKSEILQYLASPPADFHLGSRSPEAAD